MDKVDHGIHGILFDLDGVLVDAPEWHKDAFNRTLIGFGLSPLSEQDHIENFNGFSTYKKLDILRDRGTYEFGNEIVRKEFYRRKQNTTERIIIDECHPIDRVLDVIDYAIEHFGSNIGVVTNCSRATTELMLYKADLLDKFNVIVTNEDVDGKIKPHAYPYLKAQELLGFVNCRKCLLAIDDTDKGIMSAVDAGCRTWRLNSFEDLSVENLKHILDTYRITI